MLESRLPLSGGERFRQAPARKVQKVPHHLFLGSEVGRTVLPSFSHSSDGGVCFSYVGSLLLPRWSRPIKSLLTQVCDFPSQEAHTASFDDRKSLCRDAQLAYGGLYAEIVASIAE